MAWTILNSNGCQNSFYEFLAEERNGQTWNCQKTVKMYKYKIVTIIIKIHLKRFRNNLVGLEIRWMIETIRNILSLINSG